MSKTKFKHYDLKLIEPNFRSPLTDLIIELDHLRRRRLEGSTHPQVFFQLKRIFHTLESIGSARIEGNNTTVVEYIETQLEQQVHIPQDMQEIQNIEKATVFVEENIKDFPINRLFISEMHKRIVEGLSPTKEGDKHPGTYRKTNVKINNARHIPPDCATVDMYMNELFEFINRPDSSKYDLLKIAIAHHRFVWIHPFANGNGRTVRLFTYAMLVKYGFNVEVGRILNPTAVFCNDRNEYYNHLAEADKGTGAGILKWCRYVLEGLKEEIEKIDKLLDYTFLSKEVLRPAINYALDQKYITKLEALILKKSIDVWVMKAGDLKEIFPQKQGSEISRQIKKLINKKMLIPEYDSPKKYLIRFDNNYLLRGVIKILGDKGFLPSDEIY
ncbi:MAG: Fic family protein [Pseudomonadota bacterium]